MITTKESRGQANVVLVIILVVVLIAIAFYIGHAYNGSGAASSTPTVATSTASTPDSGITADSSWQTSRLDTAGFTVSYPPMTVAAVADGSTPTQNWNTDSQTKGVLALTLMVPQSFEPGTNFADAKLTVGYSSTTQALADCYKPLMSGGPAQATTTTTIGGITYMVTSGSDAGAGNLYDTTAYRTTHAGRCYSLDYTIHYTQLANYPASAGITQFDEAKVQTLMGNIVGTFTFL